MKQPRKHWSVIHPITPTSQAEPMEPEQAEMFGYEVDGERPGMYYPQRNEPPAPAWMDRWQEKRRQSDNDPASPDQAYA